MLEPEFAFARCPAYSYMINVINALLKIRNQRVSYAYD